MSEQGNTNKVESESAREMMDKFNKREKIIVTKNDDQDAFLELVQSYTNVQDLSSNAPETFNGGFALVKTEKGVIRLIALPNENDVFADPVVRAALYKMYLNRKVNYASDDDANPADFIIIPGGFKQKFDYEAFKFQAKTLSKYLRDQGLAGVTNQSLRMAFASEAFAKTQFPRMKAENWVKLLDVARKMAEKFNYSTSIFDHWEATRAVATADTSDIELNFDELDKAEDALAEAVENEKKGENATAA